MNHQQTKKFPHVTNNHFAIDISDEQSHLEYERTLHTLRNQGWAIGGTDCSIELVEAQDYQSAPQDRPSLLVCRTKATADQHRAVKPEAFDIINALGYGRLEVELAESVAEYRKVDKVLVGLNWTLVRAGDLCGVARSPSRGTEGARSLRPEGGFTGRPLSEVAAYLRSSDPLSRSVGLAAINAYWNRPDLPDGSEQYLVPGGGLGGIASPGDNVVIIGGFRGAQKRLTKACIVEREPKPGDIPIEDAPQAYAQAKTLAITAQTLMNGSLEPILLASQEVPYRMLVGPSSPACPILFDHGIDETFGAVIIDPDAAEEFIIETGTMIMLDHIAQSRCLQRISQETRS